jgi:hypothetical protein
MPLRRFLEPGAVFHPSDLAAMNAAFSMALQKLQLSVRDDPIVELVARNIIRVAMRGERDPAKLCEDALAALDDAKKASC